MKQETIEGDGVRLRLYRESDADDVAAGCGDPLVRRFLPQLPDPYTDADARWWIGEGSAAAWAGGGAAYAIADPATDRLLGGAGISQVVSERGQGEIGYWVAPWARGRGVARGAARLLAAAALSDGFSRLELLTHLENAPSQRVALAAGFRREGVRRGAGLAPDGSRYDLIAWSRLATDPLGPAPRPLPDLPGGALTDGVVTLRPLTPADVDFMYDLHTLPDVVVNRVPPVAPDRAGIERRCATADMRWLAGEGADLVIVDAVSGRPVGGSALSYHEPQAGQAMIGYSMLPAWRGHGLASRAVRLLAGWAFGPAGIARLAAGTTPGNIASQRVLEKVGFRREALQCGRLPGVGGARTDAVLFGLLPEDLASPPLAPGSIRGPVS